MRLSFLPLTKNLIGDVGLNASCKLKSLIELLKFSIAFMILLFAASPALSATFIVTKTADSNDGVCDADCSLREAVALANVSATEDVIQFDPSVFNTSQTIALGTILPLTDAGTTITGPGSALLTIAIANPLRAFDVTGINSAISNLTIDGGGIAIRNGGSLTLSGSKIQNSTVAQGGAISNSQATLTIINSVLDGNNGGGAIYNFQATATINGSTITNNINRDFTGGGGINNAGNLTVNDSVINSNKCDNTTACVGGGISNVGTMEINRSTVSGNLSQKDGGGIFNQSSNLPNTGIMTITESTISGNVANTGVGAGIYNQRATLTVNRSTINNNIAATNTGGGLAVRDFSGDPPSSVTITNSTLHTNTSAQNGGGIHLQSAGALNLSSNTIAFNIADADHNGSGSGGGIYQQSGTVNFHNTIIANNAAQSGVDISGSFTSQGFNLIKNTSGGSISGTTTGNITGQDPQLLPIGNYGGLTNTFALQLTSPAIDKGDPNNFPAVDQKGVARPQDGDGNGTSIPDIGSFESQITKLTVTKTADTDDGMCNADCSLREAIQTVNAGGNGLIDFDPTVFATPQTISLTNGELSIANTGTLILHGTGRDQLTISGNDQARVFTVSPASTAMISDITIRNGNGLGSSSTGSGGGILVAGGSLMLTNTNVRSNSTSGGGGGIYNDLGILTITNSSVANNSAGNGGGIRNNGTLTMTGVTINANTAVFGGGGIVNIRQITVSNSTISGNSTSGSFGGGGLFSDTGSTFNVSYSTIVRNVGFPGGGVKNNGGAVNSRSTIFGDNVDSNGTPADFSGTLNSQGYNLLENVTGATITGITTGNITGQDPNLGPLSDNGGTTMTHLPLVGSPVVDKGDPGSFPTSDQRGISRPRDGDSNGSSIPDIGAVEILPPPPVPQTLIVDRIDDQTVSTCSANPNDCTLRGAIVRANSLLSDDTILFDPNVFNSAQTITLSGTLTVANSGTLTVNGPGARLLTISGNSNNRVFLMNVGANAAINDLTVSKGNSGSGNGGGISNDGTLNLLRVAVSNNASAGAGAGIANSGTLSLTSSTVSNNTTTLGAGGIYNSGSSASVSLINSTVSGNTAPLDGGIGNFSSLTLTNTTVSNNRMTVNDSNYSGGVNTAGTVIVRNTIIAGNMSAGGNLDIHGLFTSQGYNLVGNTTGGSGFSAANNDILNPSSGAMLGPLTDNFGPTQTHALLVNSPAIDKGKSFGSSTDQRGFARPFDDPVISNAPGGDGADIGSFELRPLTFGATPFDFDGDHKTDISIFRPSAGEWWYSRSSDAQVKAGQFGSSTDIITPGDFTGDGKTDIAFYRPSTGFWYILRSEDGSFFSFPFGTAGDIPMPADFDGDGKTDAAVFRPSTGTWFILQSSGAGTGILQFGANGDKPVSFDYDGDGKADIGIVRDNLQTGNKEWWILRSTQGILILNFGIPGDLTVPGDYTGDGKADVAFFRPASGFWYILRSEDFSFFSFPFGTNGDVPTPGDYDGDGKTDAAVFRPSTSTWFVNRSGGTGVLIAGFGLPTDQPVPSCLVR
jgi:CSLREA domain-containing protein